MCGTPVPRGLIKDKIGLKFEVVFNPSEVRCVGQKYLPLFITRISLDIEEFR